MCSSCLKTRHVIVYVTTVSHDTFIIEEELISSTILFEKIIYTLLGKSRYIWISKTSLIILHKNQFSHNSIQNFLNKILKIKFVE